MLPRSRVITALCLCVFCLFSFYSCNLPQTPQDSIDTMIQSHADALQQFSQTLKKTKVIAISDIANYTGESIDIQSLVAKLKFHLASNSKFIFSSAVGGSGAHIDTMITKSRKLRQNEEFNPYTTKEKGELLAPDYSLTGKITKNGAGYEFLLVLNDLSKGVEVWSNIAKFQSIPKITQKNLTKKEEALQKCLHEGIEKFHCEELFTLVDKIEKEFQSERDFASKCKSGDKNVCAKELSELKDLAKTLVRFVDIVKEYPAFFEDFPHQCEKDKEDGCAQLSMFYALASRDKEAIAYAKKTQNFNQTVGEIGAMFYDMGENDRAISYLKFACNGTNYYCGVLADAYWKQEDYFNAIKYYTPLCQRGNGELKGYACQKLGYFSMNGLGMRQDFAQAMKYNKIGCNFLNGGVACYNIGYLYANGLRVKQNLSTAKQFFGKACDLGNQQGCEEYKQLNSFGVR